jgi:hypothetical protein
MREFLRRSEEGKTCGVHQSELHENVRRPSERVACEGAGKGWAPRAHSSRNPEVSFQVSIKAKASRWFYFWRETRSRFYMNKSASC